MDAFTQHARTLLGLHLNKSQLAALELYENELLNWNLRFNLTAIDNPEKIRTKHFLDSLTCLMVMGRSPSDRVIDVGTGAGFPGIPLKITCPAIQLALVESVGKKATFCQHIVNSLKLKNVIVLTKRAETVGVLPDHRQQYDWAIARAVANLPVLVEYLLPMVRVGGKALAMKGESGLAEAQSAENSIRLLGGCLNQIVPVTLPGVEDQRYLIVIEKIAATPDQYPRKVGVPAKRPL